MSEWDVEGVYQGDEWALAVLGFPALLGPTVGYLLVGGVW